MVLPETETHERRNRERCGDERERPVERGQHRDQPPAALSLRTGDAGLRAFFDAQSSLDDPDLRRLMDATEVGTTDAVMSLFPEQWAARVVVETEAETHERLIETASGEPEDPLGWAGVAEKYDELVGVADVPTEAADELEHTVHELETRSVADLAAAFESLAE